MKNPDPPMSAKSLMRLSGSLTSRGEQGIQLVFEFRCGSLTNTIDNALGFAKKVEHPAVMAIAKSYLQYSVERRRSRGSDQRKATPAGLWCSPGLARQRAYPGYVSLKQINPDGVASNTPRLEITFGAHSNFSWQPPHAVSQRECEASLTAKHPLLNTIHVSHWGMGGFADDGKTRERFMKERIVCARHPLSHGFERWKSYLRIANTTGRDHWALLKFSKGGRKNQLMKTRELYCGS